ncbi:MAG TPA: EVE domain-containing protein [Sedimentisphaerales bacterium]|nr:EVE domain-containing protein [Sedimentisphaerales bacterium]
MSRNYWLDLFTGKTWEEFKKNGATVSGFRHRRRRLAKQIQPGDYLICYMTGLSRFIGVLEVKSKCYEDNTPIWEDAVFPFRFNVELVYELTPGTAVPVLSLKDKLLIFQDLSSPHA